MGNKQPMKQDDDDELLRGAKELIFRSILELNRAGVTVPLPVVAGGGCVDPIQTAWVK